jgi:hypothetical protein
VRNVLRASVAAVGLVVLRYYELRKRFARTYTARVYWQHRIIGHSISMLSLLLKGLRK